jgi:hypothetical protein
MLLKINANPASAKALEDTLASALLNGISETVNREPLHSVNSVKISSPLHSVDSFLPGGKT